MSQFAFAMLSLFGVPAGLIVLVFLGHKLTPKKIWFSAPVQTVATLMVLGCIGAPIAIVMIDSQGEYFDDETVLVSEAFSLPAGVAVDRQGDRTVRLGDCWRNAVNWWSEVEFGSAVAFDQWYAAERWRTGIVNQIADYYGVEPARISVAQGALDLRMRDPKYQLSQGRGSYSQNARILEFYEPFVCAAIEKGADGRLSLRPCDPVALKEDIGNGGKVVINPSAKDRTLEGRIYYAQGPSTCTNPVRRAVNDALGLPHPKGGEPNTVISGALPIM
jgi:hypothetical protein